MITNLEQHLQSIKRPTNSGTSDEVTEAGKTVVAFFDLDRTLIAGYSILAIARETIRHAAGRGELRQASRVFSDLLRHKADNSGTNYHRVVRRVTRALQGVSEATL